MSPDSSRFESRLHPFRLEVTLKLGTRNVVELPREAGKSEMIFSPSATTNYTASRQIGTVSG